MKEEDKLAFLKSISSKRRYEIFQFLLKNNKGESPTFLAKHFKMTQPTISVHLLRLKIGKAILQERKKSNVIYFPNYKIINNFKL